LVLVAALWVLGVISRVDPKIAARVMKAAGGILAIGLAAFLGLRGEIFVAVPLGLFGLGLLGWIPFGMTGFTQRTQKSAGQTSRVRSAYLEMELDHDSGAMRGRIISGRQQGAALEALDVKTLAGLLDEFDEESRALLVAYLDRRDPSWSEYAQGHATAGRAAGSSGKMTEQEAYQILGVEPGASADAIARAHRALMKKLHPDQGGSTYLAARVNEAKEILVRRHR
jgi:DnaJ domain